MVARLCLCISLLVDVAARYTFWDSPWRRIYFQGFSLNLFILFISFEVGFSNPADLLEAIYTEPIILGKPPASAPKGLGL